MSQTVQVPAARPTVDVSSAVEAELVLQVAGQYRFGPWANIAGTLLYGWVVWPLGSSLRIVAWIAVMAVISVVHGLVLRHVARAVEPVGWLRIAPSVFSLGVLWGAAPVIAGVDELGSPRGSLVIVFAACVAANGVVSLAASPHLFVVFVTPVLAATAAAYAFSGPSQLRLAIPIGCLLMIVTFTGYNRLAGQHLRAALVAQHALGEQVAHHHHAATHDHLTGLLNRAGLLEHLATATGWSAVFVDLDNFKRVNDTYGHATGDHVLRIVGERLAHCIRERDCCARLGGDEYVIVTAGNLDPEPRRVLADRIRAAVAAPIVCDDGTVVAVTASAGTATAGRDESPAALLDRADQDMYRAKPMPALDACELRH